MKNRFYILALSLLLISLSVFSVQAEEEIYDRVVTVVGDRAITQYEITRQKSEASLDGALLGIEPTLPEERSDEWARANAIFDAQALVIARDLGTEASEAKIEGVVAELQRKNKWTDEQFEQVARDWGFENVARLKVAYRDRLSIGNTIRVKAGSQVQVSQKEVNEIYRRRYSSNEEEEIHLRQILILLPIIVNPKVEMELLQHANDVRDSIQDGDLTFEEAAQKFSDSPERTRGGDLGWARLGTYQFDGEAFKQETGKLSPVIRTFLGYHILQVTERRTVPVGNADRLKRVITQDLYKERCK